MVHDFGASILNFTLFWLLLWSTIVTFCEYVAIYHSVKQNYGLSFDANSKATFQSCGVAL